MNELEIENNKTLWGGRTCWEILTNYLHPQEFTLYTKEETNELIKKYFLIPDATGNVHVFKKFWNFKDAPVNEKTVPPLLVYADLISSRQTETIYSKNNLWKILTG